MKFFDAVYRKLTGRSPRTEKSLPAQIKQAEKTHKTQKAAAKAAGIPLRTWQRLKSGKTKPKPETEKKLKSAYRDTLVPKGRRDRVAKSTKAMRPGEAVTGGLTITGIVTVSKDSRRRTLKVGQHIPEGRMEDVMNAILAGDDAAAEQMLTDMLTEYGSGMGGAVSIDIESIDISPIR